MENERVLKSQWYNKNVRSFRT